MDSTGELMANYDFERRPLTIDPNYAAKLALAQATEGVTWNDLHRGTIYVDLMESPVGTRLDPVHDPLINGMVALEVVNEAGQVKVVASRVKGVGSDTSRVDQAVPRVSEQEPPAGSPADTSMSQETPMSHNTAGGLTGVTARMFVKSVELLPNDQCKVTLGVVCRGPENRTWSKYSPSGEMWMIINNPAAEAYYTARRGKEVRVDITDRDPICDICHKEVPAPPQVSTYQPEVSGYSDFDENGAARFVCAKCKAEQSA